jgi:hypothetical protein
MKTLGTENFDLCPDIAPGNDKRGYRLYVVFLVLWHTAWWIVAALAALGAWTLCSGGMT